MPDEAVGQPNTGQQGANGQEGTPPSQQGVNPTQQGQQQGQQNQPPPQPSRPQNNVQNKPKDVYTGHFEYSKVYYFRYTPVHIETIHIYDQYPQVIPLEIRGTIMLGVNLHWIPGPLRYKFVQVIIEMRKKCINENLFHLWYRTIKTNPPLNFALQAVRKYYISRCTNIKVIDSIEMIPYTQVLYKARYLQRSAYQPQTHIVQKGKRQRPR